MDEAKKMIEDAATIMEDLVGADAVVHASYYKASCQYYKLKGPADAFFSKAIMLLAFCACVHGHSRPRRATRSASSLTDGAGVGPRAWPTPPFRGPFTLPRSQHPE